MTTRREVAKLVALKHEQTPDKIDDILETLFDVIAATLSTGEDVKLTNFGKFEARLHPAAKRRNPRTGEVVDVPERMGLGFKPSNTLREQVNEARGVSKIETW